MGPAGDGQGEKAIVREDDVLMFRFILIYLLADITAKARENEGGGVKFFMEQPAEPKGEPRCASWWRTPEWKTLEKLHNLKEVTFMQGDWGGRAVKPTKGVSVGYIWDKLYVMIGRSRSRGGR